MWVAPDAEASGSDAASSRLLEEQARAAGATVHETRDQWLRWARRSRSTVTTGYREVAPFNDEPYAHHWFEKRLS